MTLKMTMYFYLKHDSENDNVYVFHSFEKDELCTFIQNPIYTKHRKSAFVDFTVTVVE